MPLNELVMLVEAGIPDGDSKPEDEVRDATQEDIRNILM